MRTTAMLATVVSFATILSLACERPRNVAPAGPPAPSSSQPSPSPQSSFAMASTTTKPPRPPFISRAADNARCVQCHAEIAREWGASLHARSFTDPAYTRAFAIEPKRFCRNCHAPESDESAETITAETSDIGAACVSCHLPRDGAMGNAVAVLRPTMPGDHPPLLDATRTSEPACGTCHQFEFPDAEVRTKAAFMQLTMKEHETSAARDVPCASCHMPRVGTHRSHLFAASRDEKMVKGAASITAKRVSPTVVEVSFTLGEVGHAFPTGDLLRRIAVTVEGSGSKRTQFLTRHFGNEQQMPGVVVRVVRLDDRVGADGMRIRVVSFTLPAATAGNKVEWRAEYQRVEHLGPSGDIDALVGGSILLGKGVLP